MDRSSTQPVEIALPAGADGISLRRWFALYGLFLLAMGVPLVWLASAKTSSLSQFVTDFRDLDAVVKLLAFAIYISLCCTFLPLPANGIVAAVALPAVAVGPDLWTTTLLVAAVGAVASTIANLNDYHLFTWMLRSRRISRVRSSRFYLRSATWFAKAPFSILVIFNIIPIPIDVIRMLATTYRYPRGPFAAANAIGRFIRYGVIAAVTYSLGDHGWMAVALLLGIALVLGLTRVIRSSIRRLRHTNGAPS